MTYDDYQDELARLLHSGKLTELISRSKEIFNEFRLRFGASHVQTAEAIGGLAFAHWEAGDLDTAASLWTQVCEINVATFGEQSPQVVQALGDVARTHLAAGRTASAEGLINRAEAILQSLSGDHRYLTIVLGLLVARLRMQQNDPAAAEQVLLTAFRTRLRQLEGEYGAKHNWIDRLLSDILACLSLAYAKQGNLRAARNTMQRALRIRQHELDSSCPYYARMLSTLGAIQFGLGELAIAADLHRRAMEILREIRPAGHFDIRLVKNRIAKLENRSDLSNSAARVPGGTEI